MRFDVLAEFVGVVSAGKAVGIFAIGQQHHLHVHPLLQQHVDAAKRGVDAGAVAVVENGDVRREAMNLADLSRRERRAARGYDILKPCLVHRHHVGISLHEEALVLLDNSALCQPDAVELVALRIDGRLGRIDVFRHLRVRLHDASAEGNHLARKAVNGEHHTPVEPVAKTSLLKRVGHTCLHEQLLLISLTDGILHHCVLSLGTIAELKLVDDVVAESATAEVRQANSSSVVGIPELVLKPLAGVFVNDADALALALLLPLLVRQLTLLDGDAVFLPQPAKGFWEGHLLVLHQEAGSIAALAAAETLEDASCRIHVERGRALVVEGAQTDVVRPPATQGDKVRNDLKNLGRIEDAVFGGVVNHATAKIRNK